MARLSVRVQAGASKNEIAGWEAPAPSRSEPSLAASGATVKSVLRVRVAAPAIEGRANQALVELLAKVLGVPKSRISVLRGWRARQKLVDVEGLTEEELQAAMGKERGSTPPS